MSAAIAATVPREEPQRHLYELIDDLLQRPGKGFRASLCLASCRAFGGSDEQALDAAVALELLHSAFLVHDDIEDGATQRRGAAALHRSHGVALALNAGDGLCALALSSLARSAARQPPEVAAALVGEIAHLFRRTVEGQAWELGWIADGNFDISEADYFRMVLGKTCWYSTIHPCRLGALIGSGGSVKLDSIVPFGFYLGVAFQIRDDIDNLAPGAAGYGKDVGGDIVEGKRTIPMLHLLRNGSAAERDEVLRLSDPNAAEPAAERTLRVRALMLKHRSLEYARDVADRFTSKAIAVARYAFAGAVGHVDVQYICAMALFVCGALRSEHSHDRVAMRASEASG
ncbi:MAG: polyprenyl synthetase family protein [Myxococcales bacterium]|nr:polyprenyl synthetase family protein [Myxococcales bacterium]